MVDAPRPGDKPPPCGGGPDISPRFATLGSGPELSVLAPLVLLLCLCAPARAAPLDAAALLKAADEADLRLRVEGRCSPSDLAILRAGSELLHGVFGSKAPAPARWIFPVEGVAPTSSIGGRNGDGYRPAHANRCFAIENPGHPAQDLFVPDPDQNSLDRQGRPWPVRAVEPGVVLVARTGWKPGDSLKGGNYVVQYLPARRQVAYYAHLDSVAVRAGQLVAAGETLGTLGRTGLNAWPKRSPTHLHFALWDAVSFVPVNPCTLPSRARTNAAPLRTPLASL